MRRSGNKGEKKKVLRGIRRGEPGRGEEKPGQESKREARSRRREGRRGE